MWYNVLVNVQDKHKYTHGVSWLSVRSGAFGQCFAVEVILNQNQEEKQNGSSIYETAS